MNPLQKSPVSPASNPSFTEACITAIAIITAIVVQTQFENPQETVRIEQNLSSLSECSVDRMTIFGQVRR